MKSVLIPLPERDFDPSEAAISWRILTDANISVEFATPHGAPSQCDPLMLTGEGLDCWSRVPALAQFKLLGLILRANAHARRDYARMIVSDPYRKPIQFSALDTSHYDGLLLPGGHCAQGMRPYLENELLQSRVAEFFDAGKPVAAICHGVVLAARSISKTTGKSVLFGRKTTALTWKLESAAWNLMKLAGRHWDPDYYRTYLDRSVQSEVTAALARPEDFHEPQRFLQSSGLFRDSDRGLGPAFVVRDGNYVSARWPGDAHGFAREFVGLL